MSLRLLHLLAQHRLPVSVASGEQIDAVRMLRLAGHVRAHIPAPLQLLEGGCQQPPATVLELTPLGRRMVRRLAQLRGD